MEKEQFKRELQEALKNPKAYFEIRKQKDPITGKKTTVYNKEKLDGFFQAFSTHYLDADLEGLTDKFPVVEFKHLEERDKHAVGKYNHKENSIALNLDMFLTGSMSSTVFTGFLATLCHEHQHFKQNLYVDLRKAGKDEQAKKLEPMIGLTPESIHGASIEEIEKSIREPITGQSLIAHDLFMEHTIPEKHKKMKSGNVFVDNVGRMVSKRSPIEVAHYFHDAHEVDARERAVDVFDKKLTEISQGDPLIDKYKNRMTKFLTKFNKEVLKIQPKEVLDLFLEEKEKIGAEHFLSFAGRIEEVLNKEKIDISSINDQGRFRFDHKPNKTEVERQAFVIVLKDKLASLPEQEAQKLLETLQNSGNEYAAHIANQFMGKPEISKPTASQIAEERESIEPSSPAPETETRHREESRRAHEQELSPEELELLEQQQMSINRHDD